MQAARPKCPAGPDQAKAHGLPYAPKPCRRPLRLNAADFMWECPVHGAVTTPQSLVARQGYA